MEPKPSMNNLETIKSQDLYKPQGGIERAPFSPETSIERQVETPRQEIAKSPVALTQAPPLLPTPIQSDDDVAAPVISDSPLVAGDDDLIEKEWVDKAKQIVISTKDDPYRREQEVAKLQADYLRKRYGKELGASQ